MSINLQRVWEKNRAHAKSLGLVLAGLSLLYVAIQPNLMRARSIREQQATGLGVPGSLQPFWREPPRFTTSIINAQLAGVVAGIPGPDATKAGAAARETSAGPPPPPPPSDRDDRRLVRTASLNLVVQNPANAAAKIRQLAESLGGFLVSSEVNGTDNEQQASVAIRVPTGRFEQARAAIRNFGLRVDSDQVQAQDVTTQYVDQDARLRNLRAQEAQYLTILKRAANVKDTLAVSEKLDEVRGEIEQQEAEFKVLSKQIETVAINVDLRAEDDTKVFGLHWRPLYELKTAARDGLNSLADYAASMASILFSLPTVALWMFTILFGAAVAWRVLRWSFRVFFGFPQKPSPDKSLSEKAVS